MSRDSSQYKPGAGLRRTLHEVIFEAETPAGKGFDVALIACICLSVAVVMLDSVDSLASAHGDVFYILEWVLTGLFSLEYGLRLVSSTQPLRYARSFYGLVDLMAILPTYLSLFFAGSKYLVVVRVLRILRIFRVLKLVTYMGEADLLARALWASRRKVTVFLFAVFTQVVIFGSLMYVIEGRANGFTSIPRSIYWAIVTLTTVGYGDISPQTDFGQTVAAVIMVLGYGIIAVPTGIVSVELANAVRSTSRRCGRCKEAIHDVDAVFCKFCGERLTQSTKFPTE